MGYTPFKEKVGWGGGGFILGRVVNAVGVLVPFAACLVKGGGYLYSCMAEILGIM